MINSKAVRIPSQLKDWTPGATSSFHIVAQRWRGEERQYGGIFGTACRAMPPGKGDSRDWQKDKGESQTAGNIEWLSAL